MDSQKPLGGYAMVFVVLLFCLTIRSTGTAQIKPTRRILILNEVNTNYPGIPLIDQGIRTSLDSSPDKLEMYREYMDTVLFSDPADQQRIRDFIVRKYQYRQPDVIITVGPSPLKFMREVHRKAFPGVPIVFCLPHWVPSSLTLDADFTGAQNGLAPAATVDAALRLRPDTKHIVVVGGASSIDRQLEDVVEAELKPYESSFEVLYLTNLTMPDLVKQLKRLPNHTIVVFSSFTSDAAGTKFISGAEAGPMVVAAANAPVFSLSDVSLNHGEVGGQLSSLSEQGRIAGEIVLRIFKGEKPKDIPWVKSKTIPMFDWRALKHWNLMESNLPPGSIVLNREPTAWESYKWYIIGSISLIFLEALLIFGLTWHRKRLKNAEAELRKSRERLARIVGTAMDAIITIDEEQRIMLFNTAAEKMFGCTQDKAIGTSINHFIPQGFRSKNGAEIFRFCDSDVTTSIMGELRAVRMNGQAFPIEASISRAESGGKRLFTVIIRDITERRQAEEALASVGRRLIEAHEEERTWIGRELHDDINQRLALVTVEIDRWSKQPTVNTQFHDQVQHAKQRITEIARDVQGLSHRLHSSKLEYLGLASAANSFCKELSEQKNVEIDFSHAGIPRSLCKEISLCLFRVLQEALQNALKHSGANHFGVDLRAIPQRIQLTVSDMGVGFDQQAAVNLRGLGLISMHERLQLVNGELLIKSDPSQGTTICARVPLREEPAFDSMAG